MLLNSTKTYNLENNNKLYKEKLISLCGKENKTYKIVMTSTEQTENIEVTQKFIKNWTFYLRNNTTNKKLLTNLIRARTLPSKQLANLFFPYNNNYCSISMLFEHSGKD